MASKYAVLHFYIKLKLIISNRNFFLYITSTGASDMLNYRTKDQRRTCHPGFRLKHIQGPQVLSRTLITSPSCPCWPLQFFCLFSTFSRPQQRSDRSLACHLQAFSLVGVRLFLHLLTLLIILQVKTGE